MKPHKRLVQSLADIHRNLTTIKLDHWLKTQPRSTRRGVARGKFRLPHYVVQ